ncbi:hypothetical protein [Nitratidesulfovibrio vulgaris]|uniref:hypothetical protein n=1 Tax=Nitratidesulfovibrio vulgaris TaxID=881 RepID=UPI001CBD4377|nr:hypothetical protein [Nitratidesulfovibrio vulgaris]
MLKVLVCTRRQGEGSIVAAEIALAPAFAAATHLEGVGRGWKAKIPVNSAASFATANGKGTGHEQAGTSEGMLVFTPLLGSESGV